MTKLTINGAVTTAQFDHFLGKMRNSDQLQAKFKGADKAGNIIYELRTVSKRQLKLQKLVRGKEYIAARRLNAEVALLEGFRQMRLDHSNVDLSFTSQTLGKNNIQAKFDQAKETKGAFDDFVQNEHIPRTIAAALKLIETNHLRKEGIFRLSGMDSKVRKGYERIVHQGAGLDSKMDAHDLANIVKGLMRQYDGLLDSKFEKICDAIDADTPPNEVRELLDELPPQKLAVLSLFVRHATKIAENAAANDRGEPGNLMDAANMAIILGPSLLNEAGKANETKTRQAQKVSEYLINHAVALFSEDDQGSAEVATQEAQRPPARSADDESSRSELICFVDTGPEAPETSESSVVSSSTTSDD